MQTVRITTTQNIDIEYEVAGLGERILGYLIDVGILIAFCIATLIISSKLGINESIGRYGITLPVVMIMLVCAFYDLAAEVFFNGQSAGKRIMKIRVISLDGTSPTVGQFALRWLFRLVDFTMSSGAAAVIAVAVSQNKQRIGDLVAGTTVIKTKPRTSFDHIAFAPAGENYEPGFANADTLAEKDIILIHEVLNNFRRSGNSHLLYDTARKVKEHLQVKNTGIDDFTFLNQVVKDYNHLVAKTEA